MELCYIGNKSLHGLFCKNVHILVNRVTFNKVAFLFVLRWVSRAAVSVTFLSASRWHDRPAVTFAD